MTLARQLIFKYVSPRPALWLCLFLLLLVLIFVQPILLPPPGTAAGGADIRALFVPWLTTARQAVHGGRLPLWDMRQSGGYPFLANPQVAFFYPPTWLAFLLPVRIAVGWHIALHIFLLGSGSLLLARALRSTWFGALLAALTISFSGFVTARVFAGHIGVLATFSWLPWLMMASIWAARRATIAAAVLAGLPFGLAILAGHTTSLIYVGLFWISFCAYLSWVEKSALPWRNMVISAVVGSALAAVQLVPLLQLSFFSTRAAASDFQFASDYSLPVGHLLTLLVPEFFGEPTRVGYWSVPLFEEFAYYAGIVPLVALVLALRRPTERTWLFTLVAIAGLWIALGRNTFLYQRLYDWLPPFRLARAPARAAVLYTFSIAFLLADSVSHWRSSPDDRQLERTMRPTIAIGVVAGITALAATGAAFVSQHPSDTSGRLWHQLGGWVWLTLVLILGGGLLWRYLTAETSPRRRYFFGVALAVLVVADLWHFGYKLVRVEPAAPALLWHHAAQVIGDTPERVLPWGVSIFEQNGASQVGLDSIFGYNALALAANDALTGSVADPRSTAYDLFSVGYVLSGVPLDNFTDGERGLSLIDNSKDAWIYRRARVMPLARLVPEVEIISDDAAAIERIHQPDFDPARTVILAEAADCMSGTTSPQIIQNAGLISRSSTYWHIETEASNPGILVVSESVFPGWRVFVDGEPDEVITAYTALRAVCVPAGAHSVEWHYRPYLYVVGLLITLASIVILLWAIRFQKAQA